MTNLLCRRTREKANANPIQKAFDGRVLVLPPCEANTVVVAKVGGPIRLTFDELRACAQSFRSLTGLNLLPTIARFVEKSKETGGRIDL